VTSAIARARDVLYHARAARTWPARDEKILSGWNGMMLRAVAEGARAFGSESLRGLALANGEFLFREMVHGGRVMRSHKDGVTRLPGYLEDHAAVALGAIALYELTFDRAWLDRARSLADTIVEWFWDDDAGAFYDTASDHEALITRPRDVADNATPSGTSLAVELSLRMAELFGDTSHRARAERVLSAMVEPMARYPLAFGHLLCAADMGIHGATELAIVGDPAGPGFAALAGEAARRFIPALVLCGGTADENADVPLLAHRTMGDGRATAYLCRQYTCDAPVNDAAGLGAQLDALRATR
jgi:uncharacterized protein YyaL (SSP411 family)